MKDVMALLLSDTYKQCHDRMYPKGLTKLVSYWVPRKSMLKRQDKMVFFGGGTRRWRFWRIRNCTG